MEASSRQWKPPKLTPMLAVIAIPEFVPADAAWIDTIRRAHDPQYDRVAAHVTLAFPQQPEDPDWFAGHVAAVAAGTAPVEAVFDRLDRMDDPFQPKYRSGFSKVNSLVILAVSGSTR